MKISEMGSAGTGEEYICLSFQQNHGRKFGARGTSPSARAKTMHSVPFCIFRLLPVHATAWVSSVSLGIVTAPTIE